MFHEDDVRHKRMHLRRSQSPVEREFESRGGGQTSKNRSPGYGRRDGPDRARVNGYGDRARGGPRESYDDRPPHSRDRDARGGGRPRDDGYAGRSRRDEDYGPKEREMERKRDRERFDASARGEDEKPAVEPEKPNFGSSGLLAKETNTVKGVELKYNEPPEARKPLKNWRLYVFKGKEQLDLIHIYKQSAYLVGRDQVVTDIPIAHPSCSKQHAVIQYRQITEKNEYGEVSASVKPFIIDLDSTNGTHVNDEEIPKSRYYELRNSDVIKFGTSSREYVLLHEDAA